MFAIEEAHKSFAASRDKRNDNLIKLEIIKSMDPSMISAEFRKKLQNEADETLEGLISPGQLICTLLAVDSECSGKIVSNTKMTEGILKDRNKDSKDRIYVTKWERFHHYFKKKLSRLLKQLLGN